MEGEKRVRRERREGRGRGRKENSVSYIEMKGFCLTYGPDVLVFGHLLLLLLDPWSRRENEVEQRGLACVNRREKRGGRERGRRGGGSKIVSLKRHTLPPLQLPTSSS